MNEIAEMTPLDCLIGVQKGKEKTITTDIAQHVVSIFLTEMVALLSDDYSDDIFQSLFFGKKHYAFTKPGETALPGGIHAWLLNYYLSSGKYKPRIVVEEKESERFQVNIDILEHTSDGESCTSLHEILTTTTVDVKRFEIVQSQTQLSSFITLLDRYINSNGAELMEFNTNEFTPFLFQMIPALQLLDIDVLLPKSLQNILKPKPSVKLKRIQANRFYVWIRC